MQKLCNNLNYRYFLNFISSRIFAKAVIFREKKVYVEVFIQHLTP